MSLILGAGFKKKKKWCPLQDMQNHAFIEYQLPYVH